MLFRRRHRRRLSPARAETLPLPAGVIAFDSDEGEALLIGAEARNDFFPLSIHFTNQINPAYCGPASISMVLNALDVPRPASEHDARARPVRPGEHLHPGHRSREAGRRRSSARRSA